jgi:hypothetical protein
VSTPGPGDSAGVGNHDGSPDRRGSQLFEPLALLERLPAAAAASWRSADTR